jgi:prepilin-type processing-associated H-X9-DG protein
VLRGDLSGSYDLAVAGWLERHLLSVGRVELWPDRRSVCGRIAGTSERRHVLDLLVLEHLLVGVKWLPESADEPANQPRERWHEIQARGASSGSCAWSAVSAALGLAFCQSEPASIVVSTTRSGPPCPPSSGSEVLTSAARSRIAAEIDFDSEVIAVDMPRGDGVRLLPRSSILYVQAYGDYQRVFSTEGRFLLRGRLAKLERSWAAHDFVRVHRQFVVNLRQATAVRRHATGAAVVAFADGHEVPVARRHVAELRRRLSR